MKNLYKVLFLLTVATGMCAMEKRKEVEEISSVNPIRFESLPREIQEVVFHLLETGRGNTNQVRLQTAADNLRKFMTLNKSFKTRYLDNEAVNGYLIQQLAQRYTNGNLVEAALALRTAAGGRWLATQIERMPAGEQKNKIFASATLLLHKATGDGELGTVSFLLRFLPIIANITINGNTALILAVAEGHTAVAERLLAIPGINVNFQNQQMGNALLYASQHGHTAIVERLLAIPGINVNLQDSLGSTALRYAAQNGHIEVVERLLAAHTEPPINVNVQTATISTPLIVAAKNGHAAIVNRLLAAPGINVNLPNAQGRTALMAAAQEGRTAIVERLLEVPEINVNFRANNNGNTALKAALISQSPNKEEIIKLLKDHGAVE